MSEQTLALAGLFQATELVRQAAQSGTWSGFAARTCLDSMLKFEAESVDDIYGGPNHLEVGLDALASVLQGEDRHVDALRYSVGLLQLERAFSKDTAMQQRIGRALHDIAEATHALPEHEAQELEAERIGRLYCETISTLSPRIVVNGRPQHLQEQRTVHWIRALLFTGLRSAVLWRQLGGARFRLLFGRRKLLEEVNALRAG